MSFRRLAALLTALALVAEPALAEELILATTTSVRDTGRRDALLPTFEARSGAEVKVVAVGSGAALRMGADGNADVLVTRAPDGEKELVARKKVRSR